MTRAEIIEAVKVKLEEISPFDEPATLVAAGDDASISVQPIKSYIDKNLNEATSDCLRALPLSLLHADIARSTPTLTIATNGVATFAIQPNTRFVRFHHEDLARDITVFMTSEDPLYLILQNKHIRPKLSKTTAVVSSDVLTGIGQMEIYTLKNTSSTSAVLWSIDLTKKPGVVTDYPTSTSGVYQYTQDELVQSPIEELIVLECAAKVSSIIGNFEAAVMLRKEKDAKIQAIL